VKRSPFPLDTKTLPSSLQPFSLGNCGPAASLLQAIKELYCPILLPKATSECLPQGASELLSKLEVELRTSVQGQMFGEAQSCATVGINMTSDA